jgi:hypothetical protein
MSYQYQPSTNGLATYFPQLEFHFSPWQRKRAKECSVTILRSPFQENLIPSQLLIESVPLQSLPPSQRVASTRPNAQSLAVDVHWEGEAIHPKSDDRQCNRDIAHSVCCQPWRNSEC